MATAGPHGVVCNLLRDGAVELEHNKAIFVNLWYTGLVVLSADKILVVENEARIVRLHRIQDGGLLAVHRLHDLAQDICICNIPGYEILMVVTLLNGQLNILSVKYTDNKTYIKLMWILKTGFEECRGVKYMNEKLVVSGRIGSSVCWGIVSITDGNMEAVHKICNGADSSWTCLCTNDKDMVYIAYFAGEELPVNSCVYGYRGSKCEFVYKHPDLSYPVGITVDRKGFIFACNMFKPCCIHQLTESGQPLIIHSLGSLPSARLCAIFCDHQGRLYITCRWSNVITRYRPKYLHQQGIPPEILKMDDRSIKLFQEALKAGKEKVYNIRLMVVGYSGVGKTTLIKRLLGEEVNISEICKTEGIDVSVNCCDVSLSTYEWIKRTKDSEQDYQLQRLAKVLNKQHSMMGEVANEEQVLPLQGKKSLNKEPEDMDVEELYHRSPQQDFDQNHSFSGSQSEKPPSTIVQRKLTKYEEIIIDMLKLLKEKAAKLKLDTGKTSPLTVWDFAGHYTFYTTHQTFLTRRAIYLLVSDVSGQVTDPVDDECYFDSEGIMKHKVHELNDVWLNSIHSCAPYPEADSPPVILVGTHVDKISMVKIKAINNQKQLAAKGTESETQTRMSEAVEFTLPTASAPVTAATNQHPTALTFLGSVKKFLMQWKTKGTEEMTPVSSMTGARAIPAVYQPKAQKKTGFWQRAKKEKKVDADTEKSYRHEICENYFKEIRSYLREKPTRHHLVNEDFAIDNTVVDCRLEDLKRKIVDVVSQQPYWGEEIPAQWLLLEQELMKLRNAEIKVITLNLLKDFSQSGAIQITGEELDLFLRFHHDIGTILYFSVDVLRENIVLDPQWLIDALKSLITAEELFILRNNKAVSDKWTELNTKGKLSLKLIDAIWTKENNKQFHDNKEHILLLMEKLNIIAKPLSQSEDGKVVKEEDYYLVPCMLRQAMPREIISFESVPEVENTSVLCFVCKGKFLPSPVFHRLLGACLTHWHIAKQDSENLIYCGCCIFDLDIHHRLTLYFRDYVIFARVTRMGVTDMSRSSKLCSEARKFIYENLSKIIGTLGQSLQFEICIKCPDSDADSLNDLIAVSLLQENEKVPCHSHKKSHILVSQELCKFWFEEMPSVDEGTEVQKHSVLQFGTFVSVQKQESTSSRKGVSCSDPRLLCQVLKKSMQVASSSRFTLEINCQTVGLKFHGETPGNGNCFFEAVSSQLQRLNCTVQKSPQQLRQDVVTFMKTHRLLQVSEGTIDLAEFLYSETFDNYCIRMAKDGEWADHVVVVGMARMLRSDIMIVTSSPSSGPDDIIVWVVGQPNFKGEPILLGHIWEQHYQSLQPIESSSKEEQNKSTSPTDECSYLGDKREGQSFDTDLLDSNHEGTVINNGAVDVSSLGNQESEASRVTEADDDNTFTRTKCAEILLPNNSRNGRIMVLTVEKMESYIGKKIGEGGFGTVYKAKRNNFHFAIKKIVFESELKKNTYEKEIHSGRILHPFINPIIATAEKPPSKSEQGVLYLMYPYMKNKHLRHNIDLVSQGKLLSKVEFNSKIWTRCIYQIAQAVDYLHTPVMSERPRGAIFHRDLSSQNILLDQNFNAKIGDFGVSLEAKVNAKHVNVSVIVGTQGYHPHGMNYSEYNASYDVFSIGVVILEILTGEKAVLEGEVDHYLHVKYHRRGKDALIDSLDDRAEEIENEAATWTNENHRNKLAELALKAVSLDESQRKMADLLQGLDDMRLDSTHQYRKPARQEGCVSCYVNPPGAKLSLKGTDCVKNESTHPCQYFCRHCLMNYHSNPLICPQHGKTRPPFGDRVYGVFVAGNNAENMQQLSCGEDPSKVAQIFIRDVEKVVEVLIAKLPFVLGASTEQLKIVKPSKPGTKEQMAKGIENAFEEINSMIDEELKKTGCKKGDRLPNSLFIFYFSGHCSKETGLYLGNANETLKASAEWIKVMLHEKLGVDQVLVILDCCHADSQNFIHSQGLHANTESVPRKNITSLAHKREKVCILQLSSCDTNQKSSALYEGEDQDQGSRFTYFLCRGLLGLDNKNVGKDIIYCDKCKKMQGNKEQMEVGLPCVRYHIQCESDNAVTFTTLKDYIQGHMDLPMCSTGSDRTMISICNAQGEKKLFLTYYNPDKLHISIHLRGSRIPQLWFRSLPKSIVELKIDIINQLVCENVDCDVLQFYKSFKMMATVKEDSQVLMKLSSLIAIYPKYGRDKDEELEDLVSLYKTWHSNFELEARVRENVKGLCNGPVKLSLTKEKHNEKFKEDYFRISQNDLEMSIEHKSEAENQINDIIKKKSSGQHRKLRKLLREVLNVTQSIPCQILEKKWKEVLKIYFHDEFSVLTIGDIDFSC